MDYVVEIGWNESVHVDQKNFDDLERTTLKMASTRRYQLMIAEKMQGPLIKRVFLYWVICIISSVVANVVWRAFTAADFSLVEATFDASLAAFPALAASILFLPLVIVDFVRITNRLFGPICRLQSRLVRIGKGEQVTAMEARHNDLSSELVEAFNHLHATLDSGTRGAGKTVDLQEPYVRRS